MTVDNRPVFPVFDGHNDALLRLHRPPDSQPRSFFDRHTDGHLDLPRARDGGFAGGMFAIFNSSPHMKPLEDRITWLDAEKTAFIVEQEGPLDTGYALQDTVAMMALLFRLERESNGALKVVRDADELAACLQDGTLAIVLHIEGAEAIDPDLHALEVFHRAGLRSLGPVWSRPNIFGTGVPFSNPATPDIGPGLTDAGKALVSACNSLGIMLDLSHMNEKGFWDVAALSNAPLVATHSGAHQLCPSARNLTDRQLDAIAESDGLVGVTFFTGDLRPDGKWTSDTPLTVIVDHVAYIAGRIGTAHVALGSDFDGATMPADLGDVAGLPRLVDALRARGFDDADLRRITHENWLRVLRRTWHQGPAPA